MNILRSTSVTIAASLIFAVPSIAHASHSRAPRSSPTFRDPLVCLKADKQILKQLPLSGSYLLNNTNKPLMFLIYGNHNTAVGKAIQGSIDIITLNPRAFVQSAKKVIDGAADIKKMGEAMDAAWDISKTVDGLKGSKDTYTAEELHHFDKVQKEIEGLEDKWGKIPKAPGNSQGCLVDLNEEKRYYKLSDVWGFSDLFSPTGWYSRLQGTKAILDVIQCEKEDCTKGRHRHLKYSEMSDDTSYWIDESGLSKMGPVPQGNPDPVQRAAQEAGLRAYVGGERNIVGVKKLPGNLAKWGAWEDIQPSKPEESEMVCNPPLKSFPVKRRVG
ncbi:hypothetical protein [Streptomyces aureoversilis]|uniref:Uncharacterized protein n=1 Tax=Streptomyces aureoversilis TaxID=67277 RepID=A0ABW0AE61_9ACTN